MSGSVPISEIVFVTTKESCPANSSCLESTKQGSDGNLFDSTWRVKGRRFLCFAKECTATSVVTDLLIVGDEDALPNGYSAIAQTIDGGHKALRKHVLCAKLEQRSNVSRAITDIILVKRSKGEQVPQNYYTITHEVNEIQISFCVDEVAAPVVKPVPAPRVKMNVKDAVAHKTSEIIPYSPSIVLAGIPVQLNPKYDSSQSMQDANIDSMVMLTLGELNSQYNYDFAIENQTISK